MKKVYLVSKTHLDLGYTDLAANIVDQYINDFIPKAIEISRKLNSEKKKKFVWTTGSWILDQALQLGSKEQREALEESMQKGDIVAHGLPFTTHTELMDEDIFKYGLTIIDRLDKKFNKKTVSAKMTDVPGHTIAMVPLLHKQGIKLLHIGVNEGSTIPKVPEVFLWKHRNAEIVVVYGKSYGGVFQHKSLDSGLAFAHTSDNIGPGTVDLALENYEKYEKEFPGCEIIAAGLDDIANELWEIRHELPVVRREIGDSWIHGSTTDPYKAAAFRELMFLRRKWKKRGVWEEGSEEAEKFSNNLLCLGEHTSGGDVKLMLSDYTNYLKKDFNRARKNNIVKNSEKALDFENSIARRIIEDIKFENNEFSYSRIEKTWAEQREYINKAVDSLAEPKKNEAKKAISKLMPKTNFKMRKEEIDLSLIGKSLDLGKFKVKINKNGAIDLVFERVAILAPPKEANLFEYISHSTEDVETFLKTFNRPEALDQTWLHGDYGRPSINLIEGKFISGRFGYNIEKISYNGKMVKYILECDKKLSSELGAPRKIGVRLFSSKNRLRMDFRWTKKDANRIQEETLLRLFPVVNNESIRYKKLGSYVNPYKVVEDGNRGNSGVMGVWCKNKEASFYIDNKHAPLVSLGEGKIMLFDNIYKDVEKEGISFIIHNNIWGTNFPIWYEDNAGFQVDIQVKRKK